MRVFKHLIALADIAVGFLGLFFIIFAVTRPGLLKTLEHKQAEVQQLLQKLSQLEDLQLAQAQSGQPLATEATGSIVLTGQQIVVELEGKRSVFPGFPAFQKAAAQLAWPAVVVLYVDRRVAFEHVIAVIDHLKQSQQDIAVRIAAMKP